MIGYKTFILAAALSQGVGRERAQTGQNVLEKSDLESRQ